MKGLTLGLGALLVGMLTAAVPTTTQAQVAIGPYAGYNLDAEEFYFGTNVRFTIPAAIGNSFLVANPGFDYYPFIGSDVEGLDVSASYYAFNFDVFYPFVTSSESLTPYVGAGLLISRASVEVLGMSQSDTDVGLNLKGGAMFGSGRVQPFGEGVLAIAGNTGLMLKGGVYITLGR
jgi:hypothetical protein